MNLIYKIAIIFLLPIALFLTTFEIISFNTDYFLTKYEEYNITDATNLSKDDLRVVTDELISYLKDDRDNLDIEKTIDGEKQQVFGEREKLHMIDVKELFLTGHKIKAVSIIAVVLSALRLFVIDKRSLGKTMIISSIISFIAIFILFLMINIDFDKYFTYFHEIFFKNDLWQLNPKTDVLIQMLPLEFFYSIATKISTWFIIELIGVLFMGIYLSKFSKTIKLTEENYINRV